MAQDKRFPMKQYTRNVQRGMSTTVYVAGTHHHFAEEKPGTGARTTHTYHHQLKVLAADARGFNPFTAPTWKVSVLNDARTDSPANRIFSGPITSIFNAMCFDEIPFACQCEKEDKKGYWFQISHFYGWFSNEIMAVKGFISL